MNKKVTSLYIHIPFCKDRCIYCDFYSEIVNNKAKYIDPYIESLKKEFYYYKKYLGKIKTIYIGGGTPSSLPSYSIEKLLSFLTTELILSERYEFTFEMNPESVNNAILTILKNYRVNRISLGIQSLNNIILKKLNRIHNRDTALSSLGKIFSCGFENVGVDLLIGTSSNTSNFLLNMEELILSNFPIKHISAYILTLEKSKKNSIPDEIYNIDENTIVEQYTRLHEFLSDHGFLHYEISNYALKNFESIHNLNYWENGYYIGLGASAAGHYKDENNQIIRYKNVSDLDAYIHGLIENMPVFAEFEKIDRLTDINEKIMLGIRTGYGLSLRELKRRLTKEQMDILMKKINRFISEDLLMYDNGFIIPCIPNGYIMNNLIARELIF